MKIGDRVIMLEDYGFAKKGMTGKVIKPEYRIFAETYCDVEFDHPCEDGWISHGLVPSGRGYYVPASAIKLLGNDINWKIIIAVNGDTTTAKLIQEGKCIKEVSVNRYFKDTYNAEIGAKEAISKLFKPAGYTGKVVCCNDSGCRGFTKGKIYKFYNGSCIDDNGKSRQAENFAYLFDKHFIKVIE